MKMTKAENTANSGVGFFGLLTIAFIVLKLTNQIDWSWWWVLSPLWIPLALVVLIITVAIIIAILGGPSKK